MVKKLCLTMIVKNEGKIIARCLDQVKNIVSMISVCDTGSTDNTVHTILNWGKQHNIPTRVHCYRLQTTDQVWIKKLQEQGALLENGYWCFPTLDYLGVEIKETIENQVRYFHFLDRKVTKKEMLETFPSLILEHLGIEGVLETEWFRDFGTNRTNSILRAQESFPDSDYLLLLDADMKLVVSPKFNSDELVDDIYTLIQGKIGFSYHNNRLLKTSGKYQCVGRTHEYYTALFNAKTSSLNTLRIIDVEDGGCKQDKLERDEQLLTEDIEEKPDSPRGYFYRANTRRALGLTYKLPHYFKLAIEDYTKRIGMGGYQEEVTYSQYYMGNCYMHLKDYPNAVYHYMLTLEQDPNRLEPIMELARMHRLQGQHHMAFAYALMGYHKVPPEVPVGKLFLDETCYIPEGMFAYEMALTAYYSKRMKEGLTACDLIVFSKDPRAVNKMHIINNVMPYYAIDTVGHIVKKQPQVDTFPVRDVYEHCHHYLVVDRYQDMTLLELSGKDKLYRLYDHRNKLYGPLLKIPPGSIIQGLSSQGIMYHNGTYLHRINVKLNHEQSTPKSTQEAEVSADDCWDYFYNELYTPSVCNETVLSLAKKIETTYPVKARFMRLWYGRMTSNYDLCRQNIKPEDPPSELEVEFMNEISIVAFYLPDKPLGLTMSDRLLSHENGKRFKHLTYRNLPYYCDPIPTVNQIPLRSELIKEGFYPCNPSGIVSNGKYLSVLRTVDYQQEYACVWHCVNGECHTENILMYFDQNNHISKQHALVDTVKIIRKATRPIFGIEDVRLFLFQDQLWGMYTEVEVNENNLPSIGLLQINEEGEVVKKVFLERPNHNRVEKNWLPFVRDSKLYAIYNLNPMTVFSIDHVTGEYQVVCKNEIPEQWRGLELRGSGAPIYVPGIGYLVVSHEVGIFTYKGYTNARKYMHRFILLNEQLDNIVMVSKPFILLSQGVEMVLSIAYKEPYVAMWCGINDQNAYIFEIELDVVRQFLNLM